MMKITQVRIRATGQTIFSHLSKKSVHGVTHREQCTMNHHDGMTARDHQHRGRAHTGPHEVIMNILALVRAMEPSFKASHEKRKLENTEEL